jgi:AraC-like DNA-binding protein
MRPEVMVTSHDSPGLTWEMARWRAHPALADHVAGYTGYVEATADELVRRETPSGTVTVIFSFGDPIDVAMPGSPEPGPGRVTSFVAGLHESHALVGNRGRQSGVQLDLTPLGAFRLLGMPMHEIANQVVALDALGDGRIDRTVGDLTERLASARTWTERADIVDRYLLRLAADAPDPDPEVVWAWRQLTSSGGLVPVGLLAEEIGWSRRHLVRRFGRQVGLAPKPAARVLRFERAVGLLRERHPGTSIADVAAACGYADHSHLDREFRRLAGCTPSELLAAELPDDGGIAG